MDNYEKFIKTYGRKTEYLEMSELARQLFDSFIFPNLWLHGIIKDTNKKLGELTNLSESTVEKKLRELDRKGFITRTLERDYDQDLKLWTSRRTIELHPEIKKMLLLQFNVKPIAVLEAEFKEKALKNKIIQEEIQESSKEIKGTKKESVNKTQEDDFESYFKKAEKGRR